MLNKNDFINLWQRDNKEEVFNLLNTHYSEPHRFYHNSNHIIYCLELFKKVAHYALDPAGVRKAIYFHDVIYEPKANDNEFKSSELYLALSDGDDLLERHNVSEMILATRHDRLFDSADDMLIADIDLSNLGLSEKEFDKNWELIREEYRELVSDDKEFLTGRLNILKKFLDYPYIYQTELFQNIFEDNARKNIKRWLTKI